MSLLEIAGIVVGVYVIPTYALMKAASDADDVTEKWYEEGGCRND